MEPADQDNFRRKRDTSYPTRNSSHPTGMTAHSPTASTRYSPTFFFLVAAVIIGLFAAVLILRSATAGKVKLENKRVLQPVTTAPTH